VSDTTPRAAAIRYWDEDRRMWVVLNPRDPKYSSFIFKSTHYWDGSKWIDVKAVED
jgi:hypothetical protein